MFGSVNELPLQMPHLRVAGVKHVYTCDAKCLKHGFCENSTMKQVKDVLQKNFATAGFAKQVLCWFRINSRGCGPEACKRVSVLDVSRWERSSVFAAKTGKLKWCEQAVHALRRLHSCV